MKSRKININLNGKLNWLFAFITIIAFNANFTPQTNDNIHPFLAILSSFKSNSLINLLLFALFCSWYKTTLFIIHTYFSPSEKKYIYLPATLFSLFTILGISFDLDNSWKLIWGSKFVIIRGFLVFVGYFFLFSSVITIIFYCFDQYLKKKISVLPPPMPKYTVQNKWLKQYFNQLKSQPFFTAFLTLFIAYIPYIVLSYPGIFMGDTSSQITQCFNLEEWTSQYLNLISENVKLNNHHPIFHSLLIHSFIVIGKTGFNSYNFGIFLYCFFQFIIILLVVALLVKMYVKYQVNYTVIFLTLLYFILSPRIQNYMFLITKDVLFSVFLLLFVLLFQVCLNSQREKTLFFLSALGIILLRNDGKYILLLTVVVTGIVKKNLRKNMLLIFAGTLCFTAIYSQIILPSFQITPSSRREMFSIPFQQTARYLRDAKADVTLEEKQAISQVLNYDSLAEKYNPNLADPVKATFNEFATGNDMKQYFQCWLQMFWKHPGIYFQAALNNKYRFFCPSSILSAPYVYSWSANFMETTNDLTANKINTDFSYPPKLNTFRNTYEQFREAIFHLPVFSVLLSSAAYTWLLILWTCYCLKCKNITSILYTIPLYVQLLICMAGPCNGDYFRYMYPIAFCLPGVITLGFEALKQKI